MAEQEVFIDNKGRILIPKKSREKIGLLTGGKARLKVEKEIIIIMPPISPEDFIQEMEGCIKEGAPTINPLALKKICDPKTQRPKNDFGGQAVTIIAVMNSQDIKTPLSLDEAFKRLVERVAFKVIDLVTITVKKE